MTPPRSQRIAGPPDRLLIPRRWKYAPPPWVLFEALVDEREQWLRIDPAETWPEVAQAMRPDWVVFSPWLSTDVNLLTVEILPKGVGAAMTVLAYSDVSVEDQRRRAIRLRIGAVFGAAVRNWVDDPRK